MYNLKKQSGMYKGIVGECLAKLANKGLVITHMSGSEKYLYACKQNIPESHYIFLKKHWHTIDAVKKGPNNTLIIYEIKTRNYLPDRKKLWKIQLTHSSYHSYREAISLGLRVKILTVELLDQWDYVIHTQDFTHADYHVSKPRPYDWHPGGIS